VLAGFGVVSHDEGNVAPGDIVLLTAANGSSKSTVLKTIFGLLTPWTPEGKIIFDDHNLTAPPPHARLGKNPSRHRLHAAEKERLRRFHGGRKPADLGSDVSE